MELPPRRYQEYSFYQTMAVILLSTNTLTLACTSFILKFNLSFFACSPFSLFLPCNCVCPAGPPGRPATQADGAFPVKNLSIYLSIIIILSDSHHAVVHVVYIHLISSVIFAQTYTYTCMM